MIAPLPQIGRPRLALDGFAAGDVDPVSGRLLSVAELQQVLKVARQRHEIRPATPNRHLRRDVMPATGLLAIPHAPAHLEQAPTVLMVAAHGGAGASTVALAVADAAGATGQVHLVEWCAADHSGLIGATDAEFGIVDGGGWRRGVRNGRITIDRPTGLTAPVRWPALVQPLALCIADLGQALGDDMAELPSVLVFRVSVPGIRQAEVALARLRNPIALAAVGPSRWPGTVLAASGPRVRQLRRDNRVVTVPIERRLQIAGPSAAQLPKPVLAAGRRLYQLVADAIGVLPTMPDSRPREDVTT